MENIEYIRKHSEPKLHPKLLKLNENQIARIKLFIDDIQNETDRQFKLTELSIEKDKIELSVTHSITLI